MTLADDHSEPSGLRSPSHTPLSALEGPQAWSPARAAAQALGLLIGLSLFGWAVYLAFGEDNSASWDALRNADWRAVVGLGALSLVSLALNGLMFWSVLLPLRRLPAVEVVGINAIATFLSVLPFKVGLATRVLIHHRRHGLRVREIVAWIAAMGALALAVLLPLGVAGVLRPRLDWKWFAIAGAGVVVCNVLGVALGRLAERRPWLARLSAGSWRIVRAPAPVLAHLALRLIDVVALAGRFAVAAAIAGAPLAADHAVLIATTYFLLSVLAPAGTLGFREAGVAGLAIALGLDKGSLALAALVVSAAEFGAAGLLALPAGAALRIDRIIRRRTA